MLETLHYTIRICSTPNFLYFDFHLFSVYATHYLYFFTDIPGNANVIEHEIKLTSDEPMRWKPYVIPCNVRESLKGDVKVMLNMGVIRESKSPYASPCSGHRSEEEWNEQNMR